MSRIIRYTFDSDSPPPDPTDESTLYTEPIPYQEGYYKAKAWEDGEESIVTSKSFGREVVADYIACYKFDGNTNDETGNYNATNHGATLTEGVTGESDAAYYFDGDSYMQIDIANINPAKTYTLWFKLTDLSNRNLVFYTDSTLGSPNISDQIRIINSRIGGYVYDGGIKTVSGTTTLVVDTWYFATIIFSDDDAMSLYLNGDFENATDIGTRWSGGDRHLFGRGGNTGWFNGSLDNIRIYDRALTNSEITEIYNHEKL